MDTYEKKYNEALEKARCVLHTVETAGCVMHKDLLEEIFPELAESEDEKMTRALNNMLPFIPETAFANNGVSEQEVLAWLEKQKDDRMKPIYDARESFESALEKAWNDYHNGYENVDKLEDDYVECAHAKGFREGYLFGIEKQKEQKPNFSEKDSTDFEIEVHEIIAQARNDSRLNDADVLKQFEEEAAFALMLKANKLIDQKPVEWSEEDELMRTMVIQTLETFGGRGTTGMQIDWLKSLRPSWKPSEQEKGALRTAIRVLTEERNFPKAASHLQAILDAFDGKESRKDWKPSEEQMEALEECGECKRCIKKLYEQLKKLM